MPLPGNEEQENVFSKIKEGFEKIKDQPKSSEKYGNMDRAPASFGVVKNLRDNDMALHTDQQVGVATFMPRAVYSCILYDNKYMFVYISIFFALQK